MRITPAGAGKTDGWHKKNENLRDHPRRCGENLESYGAWELPIGSPPQVRGKHERHGTACKGTGITPAGAGKTSGIGILGLFIEDHPRRCGENSASFAVTCFTPGSPPQVRGKLICQLPRLHSSRITPAGAGKTQRRQVGACPHEDHPRRCGENHPHSCSVFNVQGSPPQVRGKLLFGLSVLLMGGITPAGAGKTFICNGRCR